MRNDVETVQIKVIETIKKREETKQGVSVETTEKPI